ncbi:RHS protein, partial [Acinetobacter sp. 194]|uniref:RHS repeat-associated core domain-containing protein n=1 Tax=Acinetobacter shaoyimingii TaxID=2715164 RepID=UPI0018C8B7FA
YWYQNDHLGTPRELTSNAGNIEWEAVYQAWGNTVTVEWQEVAQAQDFEAIELNELEKAYLLQPHRFQGQIYDVETGLHYNRFRYYDPDAGRFISHDPIGLLGGDNHFQYAPNPVEWIDPWGLIRVRHYTNRRGSNGIRDSGVIKAQDNNRIYVEPATKKPLSQVDAESKYQLKQGKGRDYIEFDVPDSKTEWVRNPRYHTDELTIKGDFELDSSCNLTITQRK